MITDVVERNSPRTALCKFHERLDFERTVLGSDRTKPFTAALALCRERSASVCNPLLELGRLHADTRIEAHLPRDELHSVLFACFLYKLDAIALRLHLGGHRKHLRFVERNAAARDVHVQGIETHSLQYAAVLVPILPFGIVADALRTVCYMAVDSAYFIFAAFKHERRETRRRLCILFLLCVVFRKLHSELFSQFGKLLRQKLQQLTMGCGGKAFF